MSASGFVKGQITKAANALRTKIESVDRDFLGGAIHELKVGEDPHFLQTKAYIQENAISIKHLMKTLNDKWKRAESYADTITDDEKRYALLEEFSDHWETIGCDNLLIKGELLLSTLEATISTSYKNSTNEKDVESMRHNSPVVSLDHAVQLPKLELPDFEGDMSSFPEFWELYNAAVHTNSALSPSTKFMHLKSKLKGKAKDLIASVRLSAENYQEAVDLLHSTYNRPDVLRNKLVEELERLPPADRAPANQRCTLCKVKAIWVQLKNLKEEPGSTTTMRIIRSKFPQKTREKVGEMRNRNDNWTAEDLIRAFDKVIDRLEIMEDTDPVQLSTSHSSAINSTWTATRYSRNSKTGGYLKGKEVSPLRHVPSHRGSKTKEPRCAFCVRTGHSAPECNEVASPYAKRKMVAELHLCWKCLRGGHRSSQCEVQPCFKCGKAHHNSLCYVKSRSPSTSRSNSPRQRQPYRKDSTDSSASLSFRNRSRSRSRSQSPNYRGRSPQRSNKHSRRGSPYPKVGFRSPPTSHTYSTPSYLQRESMEEAETAETDQDVQQYEDSEDDLFLVNTIQTHRKTTNPLQSYTSQNVSSKSAILRNPPRLMVVQARTHNYKSGCDQLLTVLLDSGSQHSYIKQETAWELGLQFRHPQDITTVTFGEHTQTETSYCVKITLQNNMNGSPITLHLWTREFITTVTGSSSKEGSAHTKRTKKRVEIDILIGMDYYWDVVDFKSNRRLPSGLVVSQTRLGPVLSGYPSTPTSAIHSSLVSSKENQELNKKTEGMIRHIFGLEMIGTKEDDDDADTNIIKLYRDTVKVINGLIHVKFPWKENHPPLADNKPLALRRLENQYEKLRHNPSIWAEYCKTFELQLSSGIIEDVDHQAALGEHVYYIPHQAVFKEDSATTKLRIVFDASSHMRGVPSLNDCVHQGPSLLPDLCGTLLRARLSPILITADVEKAFHQIRLQEDQRDATRFLWLKDTTKGPSKDNIRVLRFTRIPFGVNASPFLLSMSIKYALENSSDNYLREELLANTYVDNVIVGARNTAEGMTKQKQCKETFRAMCMNLREFMSNDNKVLDTIPRKDRMQTTCSTVKLLGLRWNTTLDTLHIPVKALSKEVTTKRTALKAFASTFDPLGLLAPLLVRAKMFIQDLWINKHSWDENMDDNTCKKWKEIVQDMNGFTKNIPRFVGTSEGTKHNLVVFSDASQRVYAAVAYLVCKPNGKNPESNIIFSKTKLAVPKAATIPRLELLAAVLATKLVQFLLKELRIPLNSVHILSDSQIALYWIHSNKPLKTFVHNRVTYIRKILGELKDARIPSHFHYITSDQNPADCATRGLTASELQNHMWWQGPRFILRPSQSWPGTIEEYTSQLDHPEGAEKEFKTNTVMADGYKSFIPFDRTNVYTKLVHITAYVLKYMGKLRRSAKEHNATRLERSSILDGVSDSTTITIDDTRAAELLILREHYREGALQLNSRIKTRLRVKQDENGLYRGNIRMGNAQIEHSAKNPILLLPSHRLTKMIVTNYHLKLFHAGSSHLISALRNHYMIPRIRRLVNNVIAKCVICKRHQGRCYSYPDVPDLPSERVVRSRPFQNTGLDYFGPLKICSEEGQESKVWVSLFTCMTTRALHLEVVGDNSASQFLLAFRRFVARRGAPDHVLSDNAPTFKLGREIIANELPQFKENTLVQQYTTSQNFKWKFITPLSPWKGGFYERLISIFVVHFLCCFATQRWWCECYPSCCTEDLVQQAIDIAQITLVQEKKRSDETACFTRSRCRFIYSSVINVFFVVICY
ncbi:Integrase catalytic domain-containing protein [Trichostrongylus colubriformis]|uniref:Integrase catalytic domain-containing protein n=1 Tax=Trichostrongylus colubriformis TaxID=6319 RepID=A0AAN8IRJ7_TRICO